MKTIKAFFLTLVLATFCGCVSLNPTQVTRHSSMSGYKYVYITPTAARTSVSGGVYNGWGYTSSMSADPATIISGYFIKRGYVRVPSIKPEIENETIVVNYSETGRRPNGLGSSLEVTIQLLSAKTNQIICVAVGEGYGETEADDINDAINRCMTKIFSE